MTRRRYIKQWRLDRARGQARSTDSTRAHQHIHALLEGGMSLRGIAAAGGWASGVSVAAILRRDTIRTSTQTRILAITADPRPTARNHAIGTQRRLQALATLGWSLAELADRVGCRESTLSFHRRGRATITADLADRIAAVYDDLSMRPGPSVITRSSAARKRWPGPLCWDDDTIDDPAARPQGTGGPARTPSGGRLVVDVIEDWHDTWDYHLGDLTVAASRLGLSRDAMEQALSRARRAGIDVRRAVEAA